MTSEENSSDKTPTVGDDNKELNKNPYVKELLVKIDVLKKGIISERKKNKALTAQNTQLETELNNKENEIRKLCKEKVELENQLQLEKKKLEKKEESLIQMANSIKSSNSTNKFGFNINFLKKNEEKEKGKENNVIDFINNNETIEKLNDEIVKLKMENEIYKKKMDEALIQNNDLKSDFKNLIKTQSEKLYSVEENNKKLKKEKEDLIKQLEMKGKLVGETFNKKKYFEDMIQELTESKNQLLAQMQSCLNKCEKLVLENQTYRERLHQHQIDETLLGQKLAEFKNAIIKINTKVQIYHVIKVGLITNSRMDITFGQDKKNNYVMRIDDEDKKVELINMLDVDYFKQVGNDKVEISYMYDSKKKIITVIVEEIIIDQFLDAYKNFFTQAMKSQKKELE
jgi:chromosome segregation ATPase